MLFADELAPPGRQMHFAAVAFMIIENLQLAYHAVRIEREGVHSTKGTLSSNSDQ